MIKYQRFAGIILLCTSSVCLSQENDLKENGSYENRINPRLIGSGYTPSRQLVPTEPSDAPLLIDDATGDTNEVVITINYDNPSRLRYLLSLESTEAANSLPSIIESRFIKSNLVSDRLVHDTLYQPKFARFLIEFNRMNDDIRLKARKSGLAAERFERYIILRYGSIDQATRALAKLKTEPAILSATDNKAIGVTSWTPNDPYFSPPENSDKRKYQWGMHAMNFPFAWNITKGNSYIGVMDIGYLGTSLNNNPIIIHSDLTSNYRTQFSPGEPVNLNPTNISMKGGPHAIHVAGIIAATSNNGTTIINGSGGVEQTGGVTGGCPNCSIANYPFINNTYINISQLNPTITDIGKAFKTAIESGMQILNWSGALGPTFNCNSPNALCDAFVFAVERQVLILQATGNFNQTTLPVPMNSTNQFSVLPVGGTEISNPQPGVAGSRWYFNSGNGSAYPSTSGVLAPAKSIVSTMRAGAKYNDNAFALCGDLSNISPTAGVPIDESGDRYVNGYGDGFSSCTGTSMAAPHISALAGLIRSVNPLLSADETRQIIRQSGNLSATPTNEYGFGLPNAWSAINAAVASNPNKLTPLFSLWSSSRSDSFYTIVRQMANAGFDGSMFPRTILTGTNNSGNSAYGTYSSAYGIDVLNYPAFPRDPFVFGGTGSTTPLAQVWVFTTHVNPKNTSVELEPIYRMSWKCGEPTPLPPAICSSNSYHIDTAYINRSEIGYFNYLGYRVDGIEGYIYPKNLPQPIGTTKLMRKYNPTRDDHAIFPESALSYMINQGYSANANSTDWLGYVYPNTNGSTPTIP